MSSSTVLKRDCPQGDRIMLSELLTDLGGRVRENTVVGLTKVIDGDGILVAVYLPKGKVDEVSLQNSMQTILAARPCSPVLSDPASKAVTEADEAALNEEAKPADPSDSDSSVLP